MPEKSRSAPLRLSSFLPFRLSVLSNAVSNRIAKLYKDRFGLSIPQWRALAVVAEKQILSATEISRFTHMDKVAVSRAATDLVNRGLLQHSLVVIDRRQTRYVMTPRGREIYDEIVPLALAEEARLIRTLSIREQSDLEQLMRKLAKAASPERDLW
jgi:DNA-binding MarR family transcriptional regulator